MISTIPQFLLFSEGGVGDGWDAESTEVISFRQPLRGNGRGQWRFVLESLEDRSVLEVADEEEIEEGERLELLAVVRGLEALEQPSRVTLVTSSDYVCRGLRFGLDEWRATDWRWERFGRMVPIKNGDLWQRVDRALQFHDVDCRTGNIDPQTASTGNEEVPSPHDAECQLAICEPTRAVDSETKTARLSLPPLREPFYRPLRCRAIGRLVSRWLSRCRRRVLPFPRESHALA